MTTAINNLQLNFDPFPNLHTGRLLLRQLSQQDANEIFLLRSDESVNRFINRQKANLIEDAREFISKIIFGTNSNKLIYWVITNKHSTELLGTIGLWNMVEDEARAEIGFELRPEFQGQGIMNEALNEVLKFAIESMRLKLIEAFTSKANKASIHLLENNGFKRQAFSNHSDYPKEGSENYLIYALKA